MKNILFLEQFSNVGGGQTVLLNIIKGLDKAKITPYVVIPAKGEFSGQLEALSVKYYVLPIGRYSAGRKTVFDAIAYFMRSIFLIPATISLIRRLNIDLVYANAPRTFIWGTVAAKITGKPVVWHVHSIISGFNLIICKLLNNFAVERILCISKAVAEPFKNYPKKVRVIYNAIDPDKYLCSNKDRSTIRSELGIRPDSFVVGYVGQIARWKGVDILVQAAREVLKTAANVKFLFVGDVFYEGRKGELFRDDLIKKTKEWNISDKIIFTGQRNDIPRILSAMDVLAVPSADPEPFSLALIEGMAAGKAVVASSHGGPAEIIHDKVDGRLVEPKDPQKLVKVLLELIDNKELAIEIGANARKRVKAEFSLEKYRQAHSGLLKEILSD